MKTQTAILATFMLVLAAGATLAAKDAQAGKEPGKQ